MGLNLLRSRLPEARKPQAWDNPEEATKNRTTETNSEVPGINEWLNA